MAFSNVKHAAYARRLGISEEQFLELSRRMAGFFGKGITPARVRDAFFILVEIEAESDAAKRAKKYAWGMQNPTLRKYGFEIEELYRAGHGARAIAAHLQKAHGADGKIGKSTVERFISYNRLSRG